MEKLLVVAEQNHYRQGWGLLAGVFFPHLLRTEIHYMSNKSGEIRLLQTFGWFYLYVLQESIVNNHNWASLALDT